MSNPTVPIDPPIIKPQPDLTFSSMSIQVMRVDLGISADINVLLFNNDNFVATRNYTMRGEDYSNWGTDDTYVYTWVSLQLQNAP